jgi:ATP-dependent exoDNAse (exonuclease V) alpha subunit
MTFHFSVRTVSRKRGQSAVRKAAYNSRSSLKDQRGNCLFNYSRKQDLVHGEIIAPDTAPDWAYDREELWNMAEAAEKRKDACVAREFEFSIPLELNPQERLHLALSFAKAVSNHYGVVADLALHQDSSRDWAGGPKPFDAWHAHVLLTTRSIDATGFTKKTRELDDRKSGAVLFWRERWQEMANAQLVLAGFPARLDHRSLVEQGILDRAPTKHLGPSVVARERRGRRTSMGDAHRALLSAYVAGCSERGIVAPLIDTVTTVGQALRHRENRDLVADRLNHRIHELLAFNDTKATLEKLTAELSQRATQFTLEQPRRPK